MNYLKKSKSQKYDGVAEVTKPIGLETGEPSVQGYRSTEGRQRCD